MLYDVSSHGYASCAESRRSPVIKDKTHSFCLDANQPKEIYKISREELL